MSAANGELTVPALLSMYRTLRLIRRFEETAFAQSGLGKVHGALHLSIGQEAVAAGVCHNLRPGDAVASTHRGHAHCLAKGVPAAEMLAELFGRTNGSCKGRGGSMHVADLGRGVIGCNGVVAANMAIAAGAAEALKRRGEGDIAVCFFGEGASNRGPFLEALNLAAAWELPVLYVCENNQYGQYTAFRQTTKVPDVAQRARSLGLGAERCDGRRVEVVARHAAELVERVRASGEPALLEVDTYRYMGHGLGDTNYYRSKDEVERERGRDPIVHARELLLEMGAAHVEVDALEASVEAELQDAVRFAEDGEPPDGADLPRYVLSDPLIARVRELGWEVMDGYPA
jgi:TPP-dependent pyruvate/acetoin dehydrogenase alpha subunit